MSPGVARGQPHREAVVVAAEHDVVARLMGDPHPEAAGGAAFREEVASAEITGSPAIHDS
jgi:hypothetical protein